MPAQINKAETKIKGLTLKDEDGASEFDGVSLPTLRAWKRFWLDEDRVKASEEAQKAITEERPREEHLRLITEEIDAREEARKA